MKIPLEIQDSFVIMGKKMIYDFIAPKLTEKDSLELLEELFKNWIKPSELEKLK